ncbi:hypothetical protein L6N03_29165, partial [Klebsiella pneumoniae]|nr:hypothetical protein [Klebsiella pneumoniae]MCL3555022.1 hypothetical protein [Klebsiella pneumoniae]MCL3688249.1 hypothetical protein [Klebsiella pneumoniae]
LLLCHGTVCVVGKIRDLILQLSKSSIYSTKPLQPDDLIYLKKDKSEKIADSIASILISFSVLLFIGYVTRIFVIFTKYYMQLSNDYENQKIAYMLSRGDISKFSSTLDALRNHNISFDKTPHPPQEKLIAGLTEAIAAQTKSKFKNEN